MIPRPETASAQRCAAAGILLVALLAPPLVGQTNLNTVLDAKKGSVAVRHAPPLDLGPRLTIEAWLKPVPTSLSYSAVVDKDYTTGYSLGLSAVEGRTDSMYVALELANRWITGPLIASDGLTWTHIAVTIDTLAHQVVFYRNGALTKLGSGENVRFSPNSSDLRIGKSLWGDMFGGLIDEVRIWSVVRSESEIDGLYAHEAKGNEPGLVAAYHFEDDRDTAAFNRASPGGLHGSFSNSHCMVTDPGPAAFTEEHEFNGNCYHATPLGYERAILSASIAPGDTDCYKIYTRATDVLNVQVTHANGDVVFPIEIQVIGPDSTTLVSSWSGTFTGGNTLASVDGYRFLRVFVPSGSGGPYTLKTTWRGVVARDEFEPNDTFGQATPLSWGSLSHGTLFPGLDAGIAVPDTDYYSVTGVENDIGIFPISVQGYGTGNWSFRLFGPTGQMSKTYPNLYLNVRFPSTGTYYLRVHPTDAGVGYSLWAFKGLADINGMLYDPASMGHLVSLYDGWNGAYNRAYQLLVDNVSYYAFPDHSLSECGGRQFCFAPVTMSGLTVSRKFFVPAASQGDTLGFMRIQDIFANTTGAPITATLGVQSHLGAGAGFRVIGTSSGDTLWTAADSWLLTDDWYTSGVKPALSHIYDGPDGADGIDSVSIVSDVIYWEWRNVTVQPGETKIYMYFVAQDSLHASALKKGPAFSRAVLPAAAKLGLGQDALKVRNWKTDALVSVDANPPVPLAFALHQNYPNPFNLHTVIAAQWHTPADVVLTVYDMLGRPVAVLVRGHYPAGRYEFPFDASRLASGVYLYRLESKGADYARVDVKKMLLLK